MAPWKSKVKSTSTDSDLQSETERFKGMFSGCDLRSLNEEYPREIDDSRQMSAPAVLLALDNHLILQEIFKYLSPADQRICCKVSEKWRTIAGPMIFEYHLRVERKQVVITKGYLNLQIEEREFVPEAETKYLESLERRNCFISLEFCGNAWTRLDHQRENYSTVDFVRKFSSLVYRLNCNCNLLYTFFSDAEMTRDLQLLLIFFPSCEEFSLKNLRSLDVLSDVEVPGPMHHLRRVYFGGFEGYFRRKSFSTKIPTILQMIPNLQEIHGVPFAMIHKFVKVNKLHLVRSIRFHVIKTVNLEKEAMKTMIQLGIKFKFLRIGRRHVVWSDKEQFMKRNKRHFTDLLEIGKKTLQHLSLHFDRTENFIDFPETMSAMTHLTLKTFNNDPVLFPVNFNFLKCFPKLRAISFPPMTLEQWREGGSWWGSEEKPVSKEFSKHIENLRCGHRSLNPIVQRKLLRRFPSVNCIEFDTNIDEIDVDAVIAD